MYALETLYPGKFTYEDNRNAYDYLYEIETLAELKGKKYQAKRNHINRFLENHPDWHSEVISHDNMDVCKALAEKW